MLTDLIKEKHLKWLGEVEWLPADRMAVYHLISVGVCWTVECRKFQCKEWHASRRVSDHEASCILEHHIRVKLAKSWIGVGAYGSRPFWEIRTSALHYRFMNSVHETYEEALIAAIDALIEEEKKDDGQR